MIRKLTNKSIDLEKTENIWTRQAPKDRVIILAFLVEFFASGALIYYGATYDNPDPNKILDAKFALLAGNIVLVLMVFQLAVARLFDDQKTQFDELKRGFDTVTEDLEKSLDEMESITTLGETYAKIYRQEEAVKRQYSNNLDNFLRTLSTCIDEKRSGALDIMDYYGVLEETANSIQQDKASFGDTTVEYNGEIWALSFMLDDEWVESLREKRWFGHLQQMDEEGIPTRRLWAFDKKVISQLKRDPIDEEGKDLIDRLALYCSESTKFKNTQSFALPKDQISDDHFRLLGKGFFATERSNGNLNLIRGVCFDNLLSSNNLGGEIDFDVERIREIRMRWESYLKLASPLKEFIHSNASPSVKEYINESWSGSDSK